MHLALDGRTPGRTPAEHRAIVDHWRLRAPANDSDILPRDRPGKGRHADLADLAPALRSWRSLCQAAEPLSTNWMLAAANDNASDEPFDCYEDEWTQAPPPPSIDSAMEMRPRPEEIVRAMGDVEVAYSEYGGPAVPVGGDVEVHPTAEPAVIGGTPCAPLARLGALRFATGEAYERVLVRREDGAIKKADRRIPKGALTHCGAFPVRDRLTAWRGSAGGAVDPQAMVPPPCMDDRIDAGRLACRVRERLSANDVAVLDAALEAQNFADIGRLFGFTGRTARRRGKMFLRHAATHLQEFLQAA
ncbi:hypothetical protein J2X65_004602 [Ancylobacter sp. 3268]|uniref:hypothetical protein n=1 Tax=Ancylobacter sp. 3268 TaxID=2817752 RepID=UPI002865CF36|nr:hypothetical protein [Ancylobacter sp. 3268]MDR6955223.1 hypothetical protein [Ancylobacter sp. 3268]